MSFASAGSYSDMNDDVTITEETPPAKPSKKASSKSVLTGPLPPKPEFGQTEIISRAIAERQSKAERPATSDTGFEGREFKHPLLKFLQKERKNLSPLLVLIHDFPDPDAMAGGCALEYMAEKGFGIQCRVIYGGIIGRSENRNMVRLLKLPVHKIRHGDFKKYPNVALVDTQPCFENNSFPKRRKKAKIIIDQHHPDVEPCADLTIIDEDCGAACVIVAEALVETGMEIPEKIGTALAYGILTDTMNFSRSHRADVVKTYLDILPSCNMRLLAKIQSPPRNRHYFTVLQRGIRHASAHRGLVTAHIGEVKNPDYVSFVADFLLTYKTATRSFCTGRYKGKLHMSLRLSRTGTSAGVILRDCVDDKKNAGGHGLIAGGSIRVGEGAPEEEWVKAEQELALRLMKRLRLPIKREPYYPFRAKDR